MNYDAIIIGSGAGGLTAVALAQGREYIHILPAVLNGFPCHVGKLEA